MVIPELRHTPLAIAEVLVEIREKGRPNRGLLIRLIVESPLVGKESRNLGHLEQSES